MGNLQRPVVVPLCKVDVWFVVAAAASVGWDIAANVRRFCTLIGPNNPADAAADKFDACEGTVFVCGLVSVWAPKPEWIFISNQSVFRQLVNYKKKLPCKSCCCNPMACNCWSSWSDAVEIVVAASVAKNGLECVVGFAWTGCGAIGIGDCANGLFIPAAKLKIFDWIACMRLASFSFCVSANFTTRGAEHPSIVWLWWRA